MTNKIWGPPGRVTKILIPEDFSEYSENGEQRGQTPLQKGLTPMKEEGKNLSQDLELYIHIPFCIKKCSYCDFLSAPANVRDRQEYVDALLMEIQGYRKSFYENYIVTTVFIGGGTPSLLEGRQIADVMQALRQSFRFGGNVEITIEANPGTITSDKLLLWKKAGINRLSIGLQSVNDEELKLLGRIHTWQEFLTSYHISRACGFQNINVDLISAIPGQKASDWKKTLHTVAELHPEHISAYSLIIEEDTPFYDRYAHDKAGKEKSTDDKLPALPDEETERTIYELTKKVLEEYGYERYEISNYAREGYECRHNIGYWNRTQYLGIGLGASSLIGHTRYRNIADRITYLSKIRQNAEIREEITPLTMAEEIEEFMFLGLRKMSGVSRERFEQLFGQNMEKVYGIKLKELTEKGLLKINGDMVCLTERGIDLSNMVFVEFLEPASIT